jgi:alcohol dehydrogenase
MGPAADLTKVLRFATRGRLRPVVDRVLPLTDARAAQELLSSRAQFGKIVLRP